MATESTEHTPHKEDPVVTLEWVASKLRFLCDAAGMGHHFSEDGQEGFSRILGELGREVDQVSRTLSEQD